MEKEKTEIAVVINPVDFGLEEQKGKELTKGLDTILQERETLKNSYVDVIDLEITEENLATFKELRLMIVKNRTKGLENWRKVNKAYFLAAGNFIQATYNKEVAENERMEENLKKAETHFQDIEKDRIEKLQISRAEELKQYEVENTDHLNLGIMAQEVWENFLSGTKVGHENKKILAEQLEKEEKEAKLKEEAEKIAAEKQAAEDKAERERLEKEAKSKAEKVEKEKAEAKAKADKILAFEKEEAKKVTDKLLKEKEDLEVKAKAATEKAEAEKKALEKELADKKLAEDAKKAEAAAQIEAELAKGDEQKLEDLLKGIDWLKSKYEFKAKNNKETYRKVGLLMDKVTNFIKES